MPLVWFSWGVLSDFPWLGQAGGEGGAPAAHLNGAGGALGRWRRVWLTFTGGEGGHGCGGRGGKRRRRLGVQLGAVGKRACLSGLQVCA